MPNPLENKLLLYYMSGLGGAMGGEGSAAQAIGGITQQQIQTENFQKLLKTLLAGGSKVGMTKEGLDIKAPAAAFRDTEFSIPGFDESYSKMDTQLPEVAPGLRPAPLERIGPYRPTGTDTFNPSASPLDVGGADLAGLTPEMISQALQLKFGAEELERKKLSDISEAAYYGTARRKMEAETTAILDPPMSVGGYTLEQFKVLPTSDKEYIIAKERAKELGDTKFMSKREWEETEPTERMRFLQGLLDKPELLDVERRLTKATETTLEPTPVNWTTATKELNKRFGKLDPTGMWAVTPELQATHRKAQDLLVDFKDAGMDPLRAVNEAETQAREWKDTIERNYINRIMEAQRVKDESERKEKIEWINNEFYRQYKYVPARRRS